MEKRRERKTYMSMSLTAEMVKNLREISEKTGIRINFIAEKALEEYIEKYNLLGRDSPSAV